MFKNEKVVFKCIQINADVAPGPRVRDRCICVFASEGLLTFACSFLINKLLGKVALVFRHVSAVESADTVSVTLKVWWAQS